MVFELFDFFWVLLIEMGMAFDEQLDIFRWVKELFPYVGERRAFFSVLPCGGIEVSFLFLGRKQGVVEIPVFFVVSQAVVADAVKGGRDSFFPDKALDARAVGEKELFFMERFHQRGMPPLV